ncbi:hypothetical protein OPT61_g916 [Boeremia exigua]|uniref:Uncharacterized protein n=1 Tax=Boeremia exigua TaxID=749465 RepID=A0ACC2ISH6_9PLEO|nr:hypothetical protein OPT61_g916 [Boeremia exigua]
MRRAADAASTHWLRCQTTTAHVIFTCRYTATCREPLLEEDCMGVHIDYLLLPYLTVAGAPEPDAAWRQPRPKQKSRPGLSRCLPLSVLCITYLAMDLTNDPSDFPEEASYVDDESVGEPFNAVDKKTAMESIECGTTLVKLQDMTPAQQEAVYSQYEVDTHTYENIPGVAEVLKLRGHDVPKKFFQRQRRPCVVAFRRDIEDVGTFVGSSIDPACKNADGKTGKPIEKVTVLFNLNSQTPNIEISTRAEGTNSTLESDALISTHLTLDHLAKESETGMPMFYCRSPANADTEANRFAADKKFPGNAEVEELKSLYDRNELFEVIIFLKDSAPALTWTGLQPWEVRDVTARQEATADLDSPEESTSYTTTRDLLIQGIHRNAQVISVFIHTKPERMDAMSERIAYMRILLTLSSDFGTFWFYRSQSENVDKPGLPKRKFVVPCWLVTEWEFDVHTDSNNVDVYTRPRPGVFTAVKGFPGQFLCKIFLSDDSLAEKLSIKMPNAGTCIRLRVSPEDPLHPNPQTAYSYKGSVTIGMVGENCVFMCVVSGPRKMQTGTPFPVYISYLIDNVPYERQMRAVDQIQSIPSHQKPTGIDLKALFFNDVLSAPQQDFLEKNIDFTKFMNKVEGRPASKRPNDMQKLAIQSTAKASNGLTGIQGPPGTGKTETVKAVGMAMLHCGVKTMFCAPTNSAVQNFAQSFDKSSREELWLNEYKYVMFSGAYVDIKSAERLELNKATRDSLIAKDRELSEQDINIMLNAENIMQEHARSVLVDNNSPEVTMTFGYKLRQKINDWAKRRAHLDLIGDYEYNLGLYYLQNVVKAVFCTLSSSAHELLTRGFQPAELIIDEAAQDSIAGIVTACGAYKDTIKHITIAGDHKQGVPIFAAKDSNVGRSMLSRNLLKEVANDRSRTYVFVALDQSYRCLDELLKFTRAFYAKLEASPQNKEADMPLQITIKAFWNHFLRASFKGSRFQVAIDVPGKHENASGSTTLLNLAEAETVATLFAAMLRFPAPEGGRPIVPADLVALTPYTGQALAIKFAFHKAREPLLLQVAISTVAHGQGLEWPIVGFSPVINIGKTRLVAEDRLPIRFLANPNNINVAMSRARFGRYIIGGLQLMVQMVLNRHLTAKMYNVWFSHIKQLADNDNIITHREWLHAMENNLRPGFARPREFSLQLVRPPSAIIKR